MVIETEKRKIIFIHPPRCSGTSIEYCLLRGRMVPDGSKHLNASQVKKIIGKEEWDKAFKFGIVRNPWDRMSSLFVTEEPPFSNYNSNSNYTISQFVERYHPMPWEHGVQCCDYMNEELDLIIKYEDRTNGIVELNEILSEFGMSVDPGVRKRSHEKNRNFMEYFDEESNEKMNEKFKCDIERWYS